MMDWIKNCELPILLEKKIKLVPEFLKGKTKVGHTKDFSYLPTDYCADSNPIIRAEKIVSKHLTLEQKMSLK